MHHTQRNIAKKFPLWIIFLVGGILVLMLFFLGLPALAVISYYIARDTVQEQYEKNAISSETSHPGQLETYIFTKDFRVNTADQGESHFIKMRMSLGFEAGNPALAAEISQRTRHIRIIVNMILMGKSKDEMETVQQRLDLQEELKASINHILSKGHIVQVDFLEFILN